MRLNLIPRLLRTHKLVAITAAIIVVVMQGTMVQCLALQTQSPSLQQHTPAQASPTPIPPEATGWQQVIDSAQKLITALGIVVGGFWAWLKFFRGRTFHSRLELRVLAEILECGQTKFLKAIVKMKNVGLSHVKLKRDAIYLDVFLIEAGKVKPAQRLYSALWSKPVTFAVFQDHAWIESAEEVSDELLFQLPASEQLACKLKLTVNSLGTSWIFFETEGTRWNETAIIDCRPKKELLSLTNEREERV